MNKPVLVVMAAGMGSRYGGLKQLDPVGKHGEIIIDYAIYDAKQAGFETVVFVIKKENEADFKAGIGDRISRVMNVEYAYQELTDVPAGFEIPSQRVKPWGTAHAVLAARHVVKGPFAVINADDYYGPEAFSLVYQYLLNNPDKDELYEYAMVGYQLGNTVTEHGSVARGICQESNEGFLTDIVERTHIEKDGNDARFTEDGGQTWNLLSSGAIVSMNLWGFSNSFMAEAEKGFPAFLERAKTENPEKGEYFLPSVVDALVEDGKARVKVLHSSERWYGVTYKEDKPVVVSAMADMTKKGRYPEKLWE